MKKTCYFCINRAFCKLSYAISIFETNCPIGSYFPTDDWLEYQKLLKENKKLKRIINNHHIGFIAVGNALEELEIPKKGKKV